MSKPADPKPRVVPNPPELPPRDKPVGSDSEGSNAVQHEPDPNAEQREPVRDDGRRVRGPYPTGNV